MLPCCYSIDTGGLPMSQIRTDIQALRGIAVMLVVLYHAGFGIVQAGYLGVDIFFVISGYLITDLICRRIDDQRFSFGAFYWQRAKRLLPAAYVTFMVTTVLSCLLLTRLELQFYLQQLIGAATFTANFVLAQRDSYFDSAATLKPLLHAWSLSVEEQYYLLAPALLWLVPKRGRRPMVLGFLIASLVLCFLLTRSKPSFAFYLLPARAWELSIGSLIAIWPVLHRRSRVRTIGGTVAALVLVLISLLPLDSVHPRTDALLVCLATAIVIISRPTVLNSGLLASGLARVGDISYSLYLAHCRIAQ
jgi:peptidoglycan/LPS O-acetylase OafA/YrhL